ncbi:helix-turn-helix domain-containing protein [Paenibacillus sp. CC-CFT747]|nr:helix-turn-helix domain-containing protein [Paenibacillus sp. CC-CFT747]
MHVNPQDILRFLGSLELANRTKLMVADELGRIVISNQEEQMGKRLEDFKDLYANREKAVLQPVTIDLEGVAHRLRAKTAASGGWTYYVMTPAEVFSRQVNRIQWITWGLVGILTLAWGGVALFASRWLYRPIDRLSRKVLPVRPEAPRPRDGLDALDSYLHELVDTNQTLLSRLKEQFPYLKQGFFHQLLKGELSENDFLAEAERFHFRPAGGAVFVCVAQTDRVDLFRETYRGKDRGLIHYALLKMLEETFHAFPSCLAFTPETGQVVLLIGTEDDPAGRQGSGEGEMLERLIRCSDEARGHALTYFRFPLSIAISSRLEGYEAIARGYEEARSLLRHRLALGENATIAAGRLDPGLNRSTQQLVELQKRIVFHLVHGNAEESRRLLAGLREELTATPVPPDTARALFAYLLGELDYTLQQSGCDLRDRFGLDPYEPLYRLQSVNELEQWLSDEMIPAVQEALSEQTVSRQKKMVHQVKAFIEERCEEDLSLQMAADHFDLSVSHLSKIFKEEAGVTFSEHVLERRMSKAREWLEHTEMPIKEIAARLSYASVQTFNRIFKQTCGMPPGEYRKQKRAAS